MTSARTDMRCCVLAGNAGTAKTFLLQKIIAELRDTHGEEFSRVVAITATTGIAATHVKGTVGAAY